MNLICKLFGHRFEIICYIQDAWLRLVCKRCGTVRFFDFREEDAVPFVVVCLCPRAHIPELFGAGTYENEYLPLFQMLACPRAPIQVRFLSVVIQSLRTEIPGVVITADHDGVGLGRVPVYVVVEGLQCCKCLLDILYAHVVAARCSIPIAHCRW